MQFTYSQGVDVKLLKAYKIKVGIKDFIAHQDCDLRHLLGAIVPLLRQLFRCLADTSRHTPAVCFAATLVALPRQSRPRTMTARLEANFADTNVKAVAIALPMRFLLTVFEDAEGVQC